MTLVWIKKYFIAGVRSSLFIYYQVTNNFYIDSFDWNKNKLYTPYSLPQSCNIQDKEFSLPFKYDLNLAGCVQIVGYLYIMLL